VKPLRIPRGTTKLHEDDFTREELLVMEEWRRVFPDRASMTFDAIRANLPLCQAVQKITIMRSFDVFATIFVPAWLGMMGDPDGEYEALFWLMHLRSLDQTFLTLRVQMEEDRLCKELFGDHWLDDDQPDIPDDDPRWQQLHAHIDAYRDKLDVELKERRRIKRLIEA
jgi:hypothetical protein